MTVIRDYNLSTGHVEILANVPKDQVASYLAAANDHSTDHVTYAEREDSSTPWGPLVLLVLTSWLAIGVLALYAWQYPEDAVLTILGGMP